MCEIKMVSKKGLTTKELLEQKIIDEELKILWKEIEEIEIIPQVEPYKVDRHPMSYTVNENVEKWWQTAPLRLNLEESLSTFWWFASAYAVFWCSIGLWFAIKLLTA